MIDTAVILADCVVMAHSDIAEACRNWSQNRNESDGGAGGALGNAELFVKVARGAGGS